MSLVLLVSDSLSVSLGLVLGVLARQLTANVTRSFGLTVMTPGPAVLSTGYDWILPVLSVFIVVYFWRGLYPGVGLGPVGELRRLTLTTTVAMFALIVFTFLTQTSATYSRATFVFIWGFLLMTVPFGRFFARRIAIRCGLWGESVAIIGENGSARMLEDLLNEHPRVGYVPRLVVTLSESELAGAGSGLDIRLERMRPILKALSIQTILVAMRDINENPKRIAEQLERFFGFVIIVLPKDQLPLDLVEIHQIHTLTALRIRHSLTDPWALFLKRVLDLAISSILLFVALPLFSLIALMIKLTSRGPILYVQERVGKNGRCFGMLKFRTMHVDAEQRLAELLEWDTALREDWNRYQKLTHDPRVTKVGGLLRAFSLDELPQLWNVLRGDMSLVGPRPFFPAQKEAYGEAYKSYIRVPPGITGSWQINGRNNTSFHTRAQMDAGYVRNWSVWLDLYVLAKTPWVVLSRKGAH